MALVRMIELEISDTLGTLPLKCSAQAEACVEDWWAASLPGTHPVAAIHPGSYYRSPVQNNRESRRVGTKVLRELNEALQRPAPVPW